MLLFSIGLVALAGFILGKADSSIRLKKKKSLDYLYFQVSPKKK